jgi:hypothetical protein
MSDKKSATACRENVLQQKIIFGFAFSSFNCSGACNWDEVIKDCVIQKRLV